VEENDWSIADQSDSSKLILIQRKLPDLESNENQLTDFEKKQKKTEISFMKMKMKKLLPISRFNFNFLLSLSL